MLLGAALETIVGFLSAAFTGICGVDDFVAGRFPFDGAFETRAAAGFETGPDLDAGDVFEGGAIFFTLTFEAGLSLMPFTAVAFLAAGFTASMRFTVFACTVLAFVTGAFLPFSA